MSFKKTFLFIFPRFAAALLGLSLIGLIYPSIMPPDFAKSHGIVTEEHWVNPYLGVGLMIALPVMMIWQTWKKGIALLGWFFLTALCIMAFVSYG